MPNKAFLEITNACNLSCSFCHKTKREIRYIKKEEFETAAKNLRSFADFLYFHLMGEPLLHPELPELFKTAGELGYKVIITTNGTLLKKRGDVLLSADALYKVSISLHAYEANSMGISLEDYLSECFEFCKKAAERGIIAVMRLWNIGGEEEKNETILRLMHESFPEEWAETRSGYRLCHKVFLEWGEKFDWPDAEGEVLSETGFCYGLRDQIGVLCDGTVVPCCLDGNGEIPLGNLFETSLDEILSAPRAKMIYDGFTKHECTEDLCKRCMRAGYYRG